MVGPDHNIISWNDYLYQNKPGCGNTSFKKNTHFEKCFKIALKPGQNQN